MLFHRGHCITVLTVFLLLSACESEQTLQLPAQQLNLQEPCDILNQPCIISGDDVSLEITFSEKLQALVPFQVNLHMSSGSPGKIQDVTAAFSMEGMQMGISRYRFLSTTPGDWIAKVTLPIFVTGRTDWMIDVEIETASARYLFEVSFVLERH